MKSMFMSIKQARTPLFALGFAFLFICTSWGWLWPVGMTYPQAMFGGDFTPLLGQEIPRSEQHEVLTLLFKPGPLRSYSSVATTSFFLAISVLVILSIVALCKIRLILPALLLWIPFALWSLLIIPFAAWPDFSAKAYLIWLMTILSATGAGSILGTKHLSRLCVATCLLIMACSFLVAVCFPTVGRAEGRWNGLFSWKNSLGWFCDISLLFALWGRRIPMILRGSACVVSVALLYLSNSSTAWGIAGAVTAYGIFVFLARRHTSDPKLRALLTTAFALTMLFLGFLLRRYILAVLGRDETFTGRDVIWSHYKDFSIQRPWLGWGPSGFTGSPVTWQVATDLARPLPHSHSMYLSVLGETGWIGLALYMMVLCYLAIVFPVRQRNSLGVLTGSLAVAVAMVGVTEARATFAPDMSIIAICACLGASIAQDRRTRTRRPRH